MVQLQDKIGPAIVQALILCIVRFFTMPWRIWKGALLRLAALREQSNSEDDNSTSTEFPVFDWFRSAWDGVIFLSWPFGAVVALITLFNATVYLSFFAGLTALIGILISTYFGVILLSLFKESLILVLSIAFNVERIAKQQKTSAVD